MSTPSTKPRRPAPPRPAAGTAPPQQLRPLPPRPEPDAGPPAPLTPPGKPEILRFTAAPPADRPERRSVLFTIDDDEFTILDNPVPQLGLEYLHVIRTEGVFAASLWLLEAMLGPQGYDALVHCKGLPQSGLQRVIEVCVEKINGSMDAPKEETAD